MQQFIDFLISRVGLFFSWLNGVFIVQGVSLLGFFSAIIIIGIIIGNLVRRAGS